jgi:glycosyltransferase involved in cell wall biosynthesis
MRLLFVSDVNAVHSRRWASEMVRRGHDVVFLSVRPGDLDGVEVINRDPGDMPAPKWLRTIRYLRFLWLLRSMITQGGYDIVHVHYLRADAIGLVASRHPRSVISVWGSDIRPVQDGGDPRRLQLRRRALERASLVTATNRFLADIVRNSTRHIKRLEIVPFGVDLRRFDRNRWSPAFDGGIRFCLVKPRLMELYGPDIAIRAFAVVAKKFPKASLLLVGSGEPAYITKLQALAKDQGVDKQVAFVERVEYSEMPSIFENADVLLQPSRWESFGVVILEAAAVGIPAIATDVGGVSELLVDAKAGLLVPSGDVNALAEMMLRLAADEELRRRLGQNAHQMVCEHYDFQINADQMERLYMDLVEGSLA